MLLLVFSLGLATAIGQETAKDRPYVVLPVPLELPNRNDRSEQCWLRIEDIELTDTVSLYCYIAHAFLKDHIDDYNKKKSSEDQVDLDPWTESKKDDETVSRNIGYTNSYQKPVKSWKSTTVFDPILRARLYVTSKADCRILMYSREATSNYRVDCESILYMVNDETHSGGVSTCELSSTAFILAAILFYVNT